MFKVCSLACGTIWEVVETVRGSFLGSVFSILEEEVCS